MSALRNFSTKDDISTSVYETGFSMDSVSMSSLAPYQRSTSSAGGLVSGTSKSQVRANVR